MARADMTITIRAKDEFTPTLRRIRRDLWWFRHGEGLMRAVTAGLVLGAFILGRLSA